jgi:cobalt-zinc-cadmium efflux system membrane fusion protein
VRVAIQASRESSGLLVPVSAVLRDDENLPFVFVAKADGTFPRRGVGIGSRVGDRQEITSGLAAGETVVAEGGLFLQTAGGS